jgi:alpha-amylase
MSAKLLMALHFHQPTGNFDHVFEAAVERCYAPVVEHFERHPGVRAAFHLSGCLLEWLESHDSTLLDRVLALVEREQVEPLGGGFYEPILPVLPIEDALDQLGRLREWWQRRAGRTPTGAWLPERVWEPGLAEVLARGQVRYTILDDQHLRYAGLLDQRFPGLWVTERAGHAVAFYPSDFQLRYLIPFRPIDALRGHFEDFAELHPGSVLTYGDDVEKFGFWPKTWDWVYGERWLEQFFSWLEDPDGAVGTETPGAHMASAPGARRVYMPNASYPELLEWALPAGSASAYGHVRAAARADSAPGAADAFVRGSLWDAFLARYPESDQLHKHALRTSRRVRALPVDDPRRERALTAALRAQCNCAYWHGLFGGLYLPHLRHGILECMLEADASLAEGLERTEVAVEDLDGDLQDEVVLSCRSVQAFLRPADAGTLVELGYLPARFAVTNVMSRWREAYHMAADLTHEVEGGADGAVSSPHEQSVGVKREDLEGRSFDELPLRSLRDFAADAPPGPERLTSFEGMSLACSPLRDWQAAETGFSGEASLAGRAYRKTVTLDPDGTLDVVWELEPGDGLPVFGTLLALSLLTPEAPDRHLQLEATAGRQPDTAPGAKLELEETKRFSLVDEAFGFELRVTPDPPARVVSTPIETLQRSEAGYQPIYQGTLFAVSWRPGDDGQGRTFRLSLAFARTATQASPA